MTAARRRPRRAHHDLPDLGPDTCVIYLRISQDRTGEGLGVERQEKDCRALAARLGLRVTRVYRDNDISATSGKVRPEFEAMLAARPEAIVTWHQDRLLRLTSDLEKVIALEIPVHMVTSGDLDLATPAGRAVARTVAAWSQYEGEQKAKRQQRANEQRAERGHWQFSRRPFGYTRAKGENEIRVVEAEAEIVRELYARYIAGESYYALADDLNARGIRTVNGREWNMTLVRALLRNEHYAGIVTYMGEIIEDATPTWEPLISRRVWDDYLATREGRKRKGSWSTSTKHLLSGVLVCDVCKGRMLARPDRGKQVYACTSNWCVSISAADVEPAVEALVLARLADKRIARALRARPDTAPIEEKLANLRRARKDVTDLLTERLLDRRTAREKLQDIAADIDALTGRLAAMRRDSPLTDLALAKSIPTRWKKLGVLAKRRVIAELGLVVTIKKSRPGRRPLDADGKPIPDLARIVHDWRDRDADAEPETPALAAGDELEVAAV